MTQPTSPKQQPPLFVSVRLTLFLILGAVFTVVVTVLFLWFYRFTTDLMMDSLRHDLTAIASSTAAGIDGDAHTQLFKTGQLDDAAYTQLNLLLRAIKRANPKAFSIYTYVQLPNEPDQVRFVVTDELPPGAQLTESERVMEQARQCTLLLPARTQIGDIFLRKDGLTDTMLNGLHEPGAETTIVTDAWGQWLSGYAPIRDAAGETVGAVGVDMCANDVYNLQTGLLTNMLPAFVISLILLAAVVVVLADRLTQSLITLTRAAGHISNGDYTFSLSALHGSRVQNEVSRLAKVFELMSGKVRQREEMLKAQVKELQISLDEGKRQKQVEEIVDSDFFRDLQGKAKTMRIRKDKGPGTGSTCKIGTQAIE